MSSFISTAAMTAYDLLFRITPIMLTGGVAKGIPGGTLPIGALTDALGLVDGLLTGGLMTLDDAFAHFTPASGGMLLNYEVGAYPFANQTVAANATIMEPLEFSMIMECEPRGGNYYELRTATIEALQATLAVHINMGGTFTVLTPHFTYTNCLLVHMVDVSNDPDRKPGTHFQFDFLRPVITKAEATSAVDSLMSKLGAGQQSDGAWTAATSGNPLGSLIGSLV